MKWNEAKKVLLKNKEVQKALKNNEAEYRIIEEIIMARIARAIGKELEVRIV